MKPVSIIIHSLKDEGLIIKSEIYSQTKYITASDQIMVIDPDRKPADMRLFIGLSFL